MTKRPIEFRAWEENSGMLYLEDMLIGCGHETASSWSSIDIHGKLVTKMPNFHEDPNPNPSLLEWMQYTGLKDKNGKEIYEGDIVQTPDQLEGITAVKFIDGAFMPFDHSSPEINAEECEVIGNIYENPELLESPTP